jgi:glucan phosphoethanolaminetransferase (alkaline phosphatase superfamily)
MEPARPQPPAAPAPAPSFGERFHGWLIVARNALIVIAVTVGLAFVAQALLPRWWSHRVGDQVHDSIAAGIVVGLFYGFVFTFLPLVALWLIFRKRRHWKVWLILTFGAILLASPNIVTLGIVIGTGNSAHAAERTLDVQAPAFRTSVLVGAIAALLVFLLLYYLMFTRRVARGRLARLRERLEAEERPPALAGPDVAGPTTVEKPPA